MTEPLILKYLNLSAATAKGHMKRPRHGIRSTRTWTLVVDHDAQVQVAHVLVILPFDNAPPVYHVPVILPFDNAPPVYQHFPSGPNIIADDNDQSITKIFCFGAFADKQSGIVYHDLMGSFPFMSFDGSVCFFVLYHYESNAILAKPIAGLDDVSIFNAYKQYFDELKGKGFKPKLNIMDNQATKHVKKILTENDCKLQELNHTIIK